MSSDGFGSGATIVSGFVREHRLRRLHLQCAKMAGSSVSQLLVHLDESALIDFYLGLVEAGDFGVWFATDGHQHAVENLFFSLTSAPSKVASMPFLSSLRDFTVVLTMMAEQFSMRFWRENRDHDRLREEFRPTFRPTVTFVPRAAYGALVRGRL